MATLEQITALESAIASGTLRVEVNNRSITYRSLSEMASILNTLKREFYNNKSLFNVSYINNSGGL